MPPLRGYLYRVWRQSPQIADCKTEHGATAPRLTFLTPPQGRPCTSSMLLPPGLISISSRAENTFHRLGYTTMEASVCTYPTPNIRPQRVAAPAPGRSTTCGV